MNEPSYPTPFPWEPKQSIEDATSEADRMFSQLKNLDQLSFRYDDIPSYIISTARRYHMEAQSFVVSLRRRGYHWAIQEMRTMRSISRDPLHPDNSKEVETLDEISTTPEILSHVKSFTNLSLDFTEDA